MVNNALFYLRLYLLAGGVVKVFVHNRSYGGHVTLAPGIFNIYVYLLCESDKVGSGEVGILLLYYAFYLFGSVGQYNVCAVH